MIYFNKILPVFVMPVMLIIYLLIYGLWKKKRWPIYTAIISLYVFSTPIFIGNFFKLIEGIEPRKNAKELPKADAIVVLSGMINQVKSTDGVYPEWGDPDRFFAGIELYECDKAPKIIFTKGKMPWDTTKLTEGDILRNFALKNGVPDSVIILSTDVQNTANEARSVSQVIGKGKSIILVTSAYHMSRSKMLFEKNKMTVYPFSVDYKAESLLTHTFLDYFPDMESFRLFNRGYREMIVRFLYLLVNI